MHSNGELSTVRISMAAFELRRIRVVNLPPGLSNHVVQQAVARIGEIHDVQNELWSHNCRYKASNGMRVILIDLKQHIPSNMKIANQPTNQPTKELTKGGNLREMQVDVPLSE
jgi:hypothetical protein